MSGRAGVVPVPQAPLPQAPSPVWTYELAGEAPVGPVLTAQGLLCTDNNADGAGTAFLRSVDLQTGQVSWSYDIRKQSRPEHRGHSLGGGSDGQTALVGVQTTDDDGSRSRSTGSTWPRQPGLAHPAAVADVNDHHHPSRGGGRHLYAGVQC